MTQRLGLDPAVVSEARRLAAEVGPADRRPGQDAHHGLGGTSGAAAGRPGRRRRRGHAVGEPAHRRGPRQRRPGARHRAAGLGRDGRAAATRISPRWRRTRQPGKVSFRVPGGEARPRPPRGGPRGSPSAAASPRSTRRRAERDRLLARHRRPAEAVDLPDRGDRRHLRGHPAGAGRRAGGRRHHRGDPLHRPVAARLRARGRDPRGLRRHVRDQGELPADAGRAGRRVARARPLRPADQLRLGPVHAGDRHAGRAGAAGHDAERLHVRHHLPRHQPGPDVHRPAVLPAGARPGRDRHQHRRGQLPDHRRRGGRRAHRGGQPAAQRVLRPGGGPGRLAARPRSRVRDQPGGAGLLPAGAGARPARPGAVPRRPAEVHAADQAHDRQRVRRLPAGRVLQPVRRDDRPVDPADRHDDRGHPHPVPVRPRPGPGERPLRAASGGPAGRELPPRARRLHRAPRHRGARRGGLAAWQDQRGRPADRDRRRHVRHHQAPGRRRPGPGRRDRAGGRLPQPRDRDLWRSQR